MKLVSKKSVGKSILVLGKPLNLLEKSDNVVFSEINGQELLTNVRPDEEVKLISLLKKAEYMESLCKDSVVPVNFCEVVNAEENEYKLDFTGSNVENDWISLFTKYSLAQFGFKYGIPSSYIRRCTKAGMKDLVCENFNRWIDIDKGNMLVRRYKSEKDNQTYVRGLLSTRYKSYDTPQIIQDVMDSPVSDWELRQYLLSPERFHLRLVSDEKLNVNGEDLEIGLNVDSSDIGRSSINLQLIIFRQVCSNGLILPRSVGRLYRQVHIGDGAERFPDKIAAKLKEIPEIKKIAEVMINKTMVAKMPFDMKDEDALAKFRQISNVTKDFMDKVIEMYESRGYKDNKRWDFINCMTEVAQGYGIDSRLLFERAAGSLLIAA